MTRDFVAGDYRFIPAVFQFSSGVAALPGHEIVRVRFSEPLPLADGFARAAELIRAEGRPLTAFCACELRSPAAFSEAGFRAFNEHYVKTLAEWGIFDGAVNPVDFNEFLIKFGLSNNGAIPDCRFNPDFDLAPDGQIDPVDFNEFLIVFGTTE